MELIFSMKVPGRTPLLNQLFGMTHWDRAKFKKGIQKDFLSSLQACASDLPTKTESSENTTSIAFVTRDSYPMIALRFAQSAKRKGSAPKAKRNIRN